MIFSFWSNLINFALYLFWHFLYQFGYNKKKREKVKLIRSLQNENLIINVVYKDSKNAKIIKKFQLKVGELASKVVLPESTILSYIVKL